MELYTHNGGYRYGSIRTHPICTTCIYSCSLFVEAQACVGLLHYFRTAINHSEIAAARSTQKVPRTGREDTPRDTRVPRYSYFPIRYPGPLGLLPLNSGITRKVKGKESLQEDWDSGLLRVPTGYEPKFRISFSQKKKITIT